MPRRKSRRRTRGGVAVVVLTVLLLFALILVTVYGLTRIGPADVHNDGAAARARMAAAAGIERAMIELPGAAERAWQGRAIEAGERWPGEFWVYWGEDANANGRLDRGEDVDGDGALDGDTCPADLALRPSLAEQDGQRTRAVRVGGIDRGVSGFLTGTHQDYGDHYVLRISDAASRIWLNGPADRTQRMLLRLAARLRLDSRAIVMSVMNHRPVSGYRSTEDLIPVIGIHAWRALEPFVVAHAWSDPATLDVCPPENRTRVVRPGDPVFALGDLRPLELRTARLQTAHPRAPVNLNTAHAVVLAAVMEGVRGRYLEEAPLPGPGVAAFGLGYDWMRRPLDWNRPEARFGVLRESREVDARQADALATAIVRHRARVPFRTWDDVRAFFEERARAGDIDAMQAAALLANADPNANLNDFNPDDAAWVPIDKTDLSQGGASTEFCFSSMGFFVVESLGRVLDADGSVLARSTLKVEVRAYEVWRETVESEFLSRVAAGEDDAATQIEAYAGEGTTRDGLALEPLPQPPTRQGASEAHYDGRIGLATLESPPGPGTWLRASLARAGEQALEADDFRVRGETRRAAGIEARERWDREAPRARRPHPYGDPAWGPLVCAVPGNLFPDGVYLERDATLRYRAEDNLPRERFPAWRSRLLESAFWLRSSIPREAGSTGQTRRGCVSFWMKPAFDPVRASRIRTLWSLDRNSSFSAESSVSWTPFGAYLFPCAPDGLPSEGPYRYGFPLEGLLGFGLGYTRAFDGAPATGPHRDSVAAGIASGRRAFDAFRPRRWVHVAFAWNFDLPVDRAFRMSVNGRVVPAGNAFEQVAGSLPLRGRVDFSRHGGEAPLVGPEPEREDVVVRRLNRSWPDSTGLLPALLGARRTEAHPDPSTWISFGALGSDRQRNFALDATVDEIRVGTWEDFEQARLDAADGRFARVDGPAPGGPRAGASFVSASHRPATSARPGSLAWTVRSATSLPDSAIRLSLWDGRRWRGPYDDAGGVTLAEPGDSPAPAEFRYRATFTTGARRGVPILETPYLDDVTVSYAATPTVLSWSTVPDSR